MTSINKGIQRSSEFLSKNNPIPAFCSVQRLPFEWDIPHWPDYRCSNPSVSNSFSISAALKRVDDGLCEFFGHLRDEWGKGGSERRCSVFLNILGKAVNCDLMFFC